MKRIRTLEGVLAFLTLLSCHQEQVPEELPAPAGGSSRPLRPVSVQLQTPDTKSVISVEAEDFKQAYLFAFDAATQTVFLDGNGNSIALKTSSKTFNWTLPVGTMDVYAIVNPDSANATVLEEYLSRTDLTEEELEEMVFECSDALSLSRLESQGMPMSACSKGIALEEADEGFTLRLRRLFSRYDIRLNVEPFSRDGWSVSAAEVMASQSNTRVAFFYTGEARGVQASAQDLALVDMATDQDLEKLNLVGADGKSADCLTLYFLENCQGDIGPASAWDKVYAELGSAVSLCSYAQFLVKATHPTLGERHFKYRFYPGQADDMCSNFDIVRNILRKVSLTLSPDLSTEGFRWAYDGSLRLAPGEILTLRYETSLDREYLCFEALLDGMPSSLLGVQVSSHFPDQNAGYPGHVTQYPHYGVVTVKASAEAQEDQVFQLKGGDASGELSDKVSITITSQVSFWKDVEVLYTPEYRGQWMVMRLPENVFDRGYLQASIGNYVQQADGTYSYVSASHYTIDVSPGHTVYETHASRNTDILRPHLWYDAPRRLLFAYSHLSQPETDNYSVLTLTVTEEDQGEEYETQRKEYIFRQKNPRFRMETSLDGSPFIYRTTISQENGQVTVPADLYFVLVDPQKGNAIIPNDEFLWGGHGAYQMPGVSYCNSFFLNSHIWMDYSEETGIDDFFRIEYPSSIDDDDCEFDIYNLTLYPKVRDSYSYADDRYISFKHSFFQQDEVRLYPTCELILAPKRTLTLMKANGGTSNYADMKCSANPAGDDFYLMYGFCQTFFVVLENPLGDPGVSLSIPPESAPYLQYNFTRLSDNLYRLDCWIDHYESPLSYDDTATPYSASHGYPSPQDGDKDVTITVSCGSCQDEIVCHVLHKRFSLGVSGTSTLSIAMWNPLGFIFSATLQVSAEFQRYGKRHPLMELLYGPITERQSTSFSLASSLSDAPVLGNTSARLEKASRDLHGVRCHYARDVHPAFLAAGDTREDLILYYPPAEALSYNANLTVTVPKSFTSSTPGLSLRKASFSLEDYISFQADGGSLRYIHSTLAEYYLQETLISDPDIKYYGYKFITPSRWIATYSHSNIQINGDEPVHLGGADQVKNVFGRIRYQGYESFHSQDPVIGN